MICQAEKCCGCRACQEICPKGCIAMKPNQQGLLVAQINKDQCVGCDLCKRVCPALHADLCSTKEAWVGVHKDEDVVKNSASGGAFATLAEIAVKQGYVVFGVQYDEHFQVVHHHARDFEGCKAFLKSKYVLSNTNGCYTKIKKLLANGGKVLFSGTPCQVSALKNYVGEHQNLVLIDLVCHGAPDQWVLDEEMKYLEQKHQERVVGFSFRNKTKVNGVYNSRTAAVWFANKEEPCLISSANDPFLRGYYLRLFYREACGSCRYAQPERCGDITLADAWGIEKSYPDLNPLKGVSLLLCNTEKGKSLLDSMRETMELIQVEPQWAIENNEQLRKPTRFHKNRAKFFANPKGLTFERLVFDLTKSTLRGKCKTCWRVCITGSIKKAKQLIKKIRECD